MLCELLLRQLNELRLNGVLCDLELISKDNTSFFIHKIVLTALNQLHFQCALKGKHTNLTPNFKMFPSLIEGKELEVMVEFIYGATIEKRSKYDLLVSALTKMNMAYLLEEAQGFVLENDYLDVKTEPDDNVDNSAPATDVVPLGGQHISGGNLTLNTDTVNDVMTNSICVKEEPESPETDISNKDVTDTNLNRGTIPENHGANSNEIEKNNVATAEEQNTDKSQREIKIEKNEESVLQCMTQIDNDLDNILKSLNIGLAVEDCANDFGELKYSEMKSVEALETSTENKGSQNAKSFIDSAKGTCTSQGSECVSTCNSENTDVSQTKKLRTLLPRPFIPPAVAILSNSPSLKNAVLHVAISKPKMVMQPSVRISHIQTKQLPIQRLTTPIFSGISSSLLQHSSVISSRNKDCSELVSTTPSVMTETFRNKRTGRFEAKPNTIKLSSVLTSTIQKSPVLPMRASTESSLPSSICSPRTSVSASNFVLQPVVSFATVKTTSIKSSVLSRTVTSSSTIDFTTKLVYSLSDTIQSNCPLPSARTSDNSVFQQSSEITSSKDMSDTNSCEESSSLSLAKLNSTANVTTDLELLVKETLNDNSTEKKMNANKCDTQECNKMKLRNRRPLLKESKRVLKKSLKRYSSVNKTLDNVEEQMETNLPKPQAAEKADVFDRIDVQEKEITIEREAVLYKGLDEGVLKKQNEKMTTEMKLTSTNKAVDSLNSVAFSREKDDGTKSESLTPEKNLSSALNNFETPIESSSKVSIVPPSEILTLTPPDVIKIMKTPKTLPKTVKLVSLNKIEKTIPQKTVYNSSLGSIKSVQNLGHVSSVKILSCNEEDEIVTDVLEFAAEGEDKIKSGHKHKLVSLVDRMPEIENKLSKNQNELESCRVRFNIRSHTAFVESDDIVTWKPDVNVQHCRKNDEKDAKSTNVTNKTSTNKEDALKQSHIETKENVTQKHDLESCKVRFNIRTHNAFVESDDIACWEPAVNVQHCRANDEIDVKSANVTNKTSTNKEDALKRSHIETKEKVTQKQTDNDTTDEPPVVITNIIESSESLGVEETIMFTDSKEDESTSDTKENGHISENISEMKTNLDGNAQEKYKKSNGKPIQKGFNICNSDSEGELALLQNVNIEIDKESDHHHMHTNSDMNEDVDKVDKLSSDIDEIHMYGSNVVDSDMECSETLYTEKHDRMDAHVIETKSQVQVQKLLDSEKDNFESFETVTHSNKSSADKSNLDISSVSFNVSQFQTSTIQENTQPILSTPLNISNIPVPQTFRNPCKLLPKVPVTMIRFPMCLQVTGPSNELSLCQLDKPIISNTYIVPNEKLGKKPGKASKTRKLQDQGSGTKRKRCKSAPGNIHLEKKTRKTKCSPSQETNSFKRQAGLNNGRKRKKDKPKPSENTSMQEKKKRTDMSMDSVQKNVNSQNLETGIDVEVLLSDLNEKRLLDKQLPVECADMQTKETLNIQKAVRTENEPSSSTVCNWQNEIGNKNDNTDFEKSDIESQEEANSELKMRVANSIHVKESGNRYKIDKLKSQLETLKANMKLQILKNLSKCARQKCDDDIGISDTESSTSIEKVEEILFKSPRENTDTKLQGSMNGNDEHGENNIEENKNESDNSPFSMDKDFAECVKNDKNTIASETCLDITNITPRNKIGKEHSETRSEKSRLMIDLTKDESQIDNFRFGIPGVIQENYSKEKSSFCSTPELKKALATPVSKGKVDKAIVCKKCAVGISQSVDNPSGLCSNCFIRQKKRHRHKSRKTERSKIRKKEVEVDDCNEQKEEMQDYLAKEKADRVNLKLVSRRRRQLSGKKKLSSTQKDSIHECVTPQKTQSPVLTHITEKQDKFDDDPLLVNLPETTIAVPVPPSSTSPVNSPRFILPRLPTTLSLPFAPSSVVFSPCVPKVMPTAQILTPGFSSKPLVSSALISAAGKLASATETCTIQGSVSQSQVISLQGTPFSSVLGLKNVSLTSVTPTSTVSSLVVGASKMPIKVEAFSPAVVMSLDSTVSTNSLQIPAMSFSTVPSSVSMSKTISSMPVMSSLLASPPIKPHLTPAVVVLRYPGIIQRQKDSSEGWKSDTGYRNICPKPN